MLEWKTGDEGWEASASETVATTPSRAPARHWRRRASIALGVLLTLIVAAALVLRWQANRKLVAAKADVQAVVDEEMWALKTGNWGLYTALLDRRAPASWHREQYGRFTQNARRGAFSATVTDLVLLQPDLALVELRVEPPGRPAYREARAYRRVDGRWRWTAAPPDEPWVHAVERETANLRFIYHRDDAERLEPLFPALQELYARLLEDFSLAPLPGKRQLQITLSVLPANEDFVDSSLRYDLSSLATSSDPRELQRELGRQLTERVLRQFYERSGEMSFVLDGIREWEVADWMGAPDPEVEARIVRVLAEKPFVPLSMVHPGQFEQPTLTALTMTVVDYLVERKGRDAVGALIFGLERYDKWETLVGRGVGLSYTEAVDGWWNFVVQRYAPSTLSTAKPNEVLAQLQWMLTLEQQAVNTLDFQLFKSLVDPATSSNWLAQEWHRRIEPRTGFTPGPVRLNLRLTQEWRRRMKQHADFTPGPAQLDAWGYTRNGAWVALRPLPESEASNSHFPMEMRFYRFVRGRWYLTRPEFAFPYVHTVRTRYLTLRYREPDTAPLQRLLATGDVDALYMRAAQDFGLIHESPEFMIEFVYALPHEPIATIDRTRVIQAISPRLFRDFETFRFNFGSLIVDTLLMEASELHKSGVSETWFLLPGIAAWELRQWTQPPDWWQREKQDAIRRLLAQNSYGLFSQLVLSQATAETLVEYIVATYGRHRLADFVRGLRDHPDLRELIPAVFGVDLATFEAGWRAYLEQTYGEAGTSGTP